MKRSTAKRVNSAGKKFTAVSNTATGKGIRENMTPQSKARVKKGAKVAGVGAAAAGVGAAGFVAGIAMVAPKGGRVFR